MKRKDRHTADDARFVREYCIKLVRQINMDIREFGGSGIEHWESEKTGLLHILRMMRDRRNGKL
jgi:hypothetical protein